MNSQQRLQQFGKALHSRAKILRHRSCLVLSGNVSWGRRSAWDLAATYSRESVLLVTNRSNAPTGNDAVNTLDIGHAGTVLGSEFDAVIYDCFSGFDADAVGILGGTIKAGGMLILIAPALEHWPEYDDPQYSRIIAYGCAKPDSSHYIRRLINIISESPHCILIQENFDSVQEQHKNSGRPAQPIDFTDQNTAIDAVSKVVTGHRRRPVVLLSDRGRGKSSALGIAAGQLLQGTVQRIGVTGLNRRSVDCVFRHAKLQGDVEEGSIRFFATDKLIESKADIDLLLVDEAASIPVFMLKKLLETYPRIAFASTVHGYEGTGRGFMLRFKKLLDSHTRGWVACSLTEPIRWAPDDPLEHFLFDALVLDAEPVDSSIKSDSPGTMEFSAVPQKDLVNNEPLTRSIFGLLVQAHYRTRPYDLRHMLDAGNLAIFTISQNRNILGVAVVALEGRFDSGISRKIWANQTRPNGHLLPELLCAQQGFLEAAQLQFARIMRIVVDPEFQRQGIGKRLLEEISGFYQGKIDLLGTTFSVSLPVLNFWLDSEYIPVRIGHSLSHNSGTHSCTLLKSASPRCHSLVGRAVDKLSKNLYYQLRSSLSGLNPDLIPPIYRSIGKYRKAPKLQENEILDLTGFAFANQSFENIPAALVRFAEFALKLEIIDHDETGRILLAERILQGKSWQNCTSLTPPKGKKQGINALRGIVRTTLSTHYPEQVTAILREHDIEISPPL